MASESSFPAASNASTDDIEADAYGAGSRADRSSEHLNQGATQIRTLDTLQLGERGVVTGVYSQNPILRNKLLSMGIVDCTPLRVTNIAPLGDPMSISVRGFKLSLRRLEARSIRVRVDAD